MQIAHCGLACSVALAKLFSVEIMTRHHMVLEWSLLEQKELSPKQPRVPCVPVWCMVVSW